MAKTTYTLNLSTRAARLVAHANDAERVIELLRQNGASDRKHKRRVLHLKRVHACGAAVLKECKNGGQAIPCELLARLYQLSADAQVYIAE